MKFTGLTFQKQVRAIARRAFLSFYRWKKWFFNLVEVRELEPIERWMFSYILMNINVTIYYVKLFTLLLGSFYFIFIFLVFLFLFLFLGLETFRLYFVNKEIKLNFITTAKDGVIKLESNAYIIYEYFDVLYYGTL